MENAHLLGDKITEVAEQVRAYLHAKDDFLSGKENDNPSLHEFYHVAASRYDIMWPDIEMTEEFRREAYRLLRRGQLLGFVNEGFYSMYPDRKKMTNKLSRRYPENLLGWTTDFLERGANFHEKLLDILVTYKTEISEEDALMN